MPLMFAILSGLSIGGDNGWPPQANKQKSVSLKWTMHKSVIMCLNNFMKLTKHGDIKCISCSLSFSFVEITYITYHIPYRVLCHFQKRGKIIKTGH